ncbi:unnamed protein product [Scytosiphon promiscuus]
MMEPQALSRTPPSTVVASESGISDEHTDDKHSGRGGAHVVELPDLEDGSSVSAIECQAEVFEGHRAIAPTAAVAGDPGASDGHVNNNQHDGVASSVVELPDLEGGGRAPPVDPEVPQGRRATAAATPRPAPIVEKNCGLSTRRWHQVFALGLGLLEVGFSLYNALSKNAFEISDATDFVFSASAVMESAGMTAMLFAALCREKYGAQRQDGRDFVLEGFGSPLAILVNGVRQKERSLTKVGHFGAMCQAAVVSVVGLVLLQRLNARAFVIIFYVLFLLLAGFCLVTNSFFCENWFRDVLFFSRLDSALDPNDAAVGVTYVLVVLPLGVEVAEVVLLALGEESWNATILAVLDVAVTALVLFPYGYKHFMRNYPEVARRFTRGSCRNCPCPLFCRLDTLFNILFA